MNPQQKEFVIYLQTCRIPDLLEGKLSDITDRQQFATELADAFALLNSLQERCVVLTQELEASEKVVRKLRSQCR